MRAVSCQRQSEQSVTDTLNAISARSQPQRNRMNAPAEHWIAVYDRDLTNAANRRIHAVCAPVFLVALLGILWCVPMPAALASNLASINWATLFAMATLVYYFVMSITLALGALPFAAAAEPKLPHPA